MTIETYIQHEIHIWGEEYIFDLLDKGYEVVLTDKGYRWVLPASATSASTTRGRATVGAAAGTGAQGR